MRFITPSLVLYTFLQPPSLKEKTETANRWGTTNNKPSGSISMMGQSKTWKILNRPNEMNAVSHFIWPVECFPQKNTE
jgi:hypothetical protein